MHVGHCAVPRTPVTTVVTGSTTPAPHCTTRRSTTPSVDATACAAMTSSWALLPFRATSRPPTRRSGIVQPSNRSRGATARAVTTSTPLHPGSAHRSSARPRRTLTRSSSPRSDTTDCRNVARRSSGSTSVIVRSGRVIAQTSPGRPAPDPTSATVAPESTNDSPGPTTTAQLRRCRDHRRGTSRGPMSPISTPAVLRTAAYACSGSVKGSSHGGSSTGSAGFT